MLEDKVIIYDDSCPMCRLYTYWFVACGFIKPENRVGFASAPPEMISHLDLDRGRHEIPLFDRATHETIYGLSALTLILGSRWPCLNPIFKSKPFFWLFYPLYQIITYNRRVIAGCKACCGFDCAPDLNRFYRSVYLFFVSGFICAICIALFLAGTTFSTAAGGLIAAFAIVGLVSGTIILLATGPEAAWDYFGNYTTGIAMVAITLSPLLFWSAMAAGLGWLNIGIGLLVGVEELRRRER